MMTYVPKRRRKEHLFIACRKGKFFHNHGHSKSAMESVKKWSKTWNHRHQGTDVEREASYLKHICR